MTIVDRAFRRVGHADCLVHGFSRPGIDGLAEPLEGGLAGDSEQVPDLLPGVARVPALLDAQPEHLLRQVIEILSAPDQVEVGRRSQRAAHRPGQGQGPLGQQTAEARQGLRGIAHV